MLKTAIRVIQPPNLGWIVFLELLALQIILKSQLIFHGQSGSNSKMLSKDVMTVFRGRSTEIRVFPLSFSEVLSAKGGDKSDVWEEYLMRQLQNLVKAAASSMAPYQNCTYFRETGRAVSMNPPMPRQVLQLPLTRRSPTSMRLGRECQRERGAGAGF